MLDQLRAVFRQRRNRETIYSTAAYWDSKAAAYAGTAVSMWPNQALNRHYEAEQKAWVVQHIGALGGRELLDLGCGTGRFARWFVQHGAKVTGVDFSQGALDVAASLSSGANPHYRQCSVFALAEKDRYDVIFTWGVLTIACRNREELLDALIRIRTALRSGGHLLLTEPIHRGFLHRVLNMDQIEFLDVMHEAGFEVQVTTPLHFWPMRLALAYVPWPEWLTTPLYHLGQSLLKVPALATLGDYWAIRAQPHSRILAAPESPGTGV
jgi:2-polyprenyl-3-methyl-5-hydroxy-6-metoxy-1,4-benzoquinol methylase